MRVLALAIFVALVYFVLFHRPEVRRADSGTAAAPAAKPKNYKNNCGDECSLRPLTELLNPEESDDNGGDNNIFFVETDDSLTSFRDRHLCAFEAAAAHNPDSRVFVVAGINSNITRYPGYLRDSHIRFATADFDAMVEDSPVVELWKSKVVAQSWCYLRHASHIIRLLLLHKYGGTYMDTDLIALKDLPKDKNFVVPYERNSINGAVFKFQKGHYFTMDCLKYLAHDYQRDSYFNPGQELLTKVARSQCNREKVNMDQEMVLDCKEFTVLLPNSSYAVPYMYWADFFDRSKVDYVRAKLKDSFAAHYWFYMTQIGNMEMDTEWDKEIPLYKLFQEHCPLTELHLLRDKEAKNRSFDNMDWRPNLVVVVYMGLLLFCLSVMVVGCCSKGDKIRRKIGFNDDLVIGKKRIT